MKRKIFSKLLMVALVIAAVGSFVSCKDYDDDINNLQKQIDAKAALSELTALQSTLDSKISTATAAAQKAAEDAAAKADASLKSALETAIADAKKAGTDAGTEAGKAITAANEAKESAQEAAQAAKDADAAAKKALEEALKTIGETYQTKAEAAEAATKAAEALADVKAIAEAAYTKAQAEKLQEQVNNLKSDLESTIEEKVKEAIKNVEKAKASVDAIWSAVTSIELYVNKEEDYENLNLNFQFGKQIANEFGKGKELHAYKETNDPKTYVEGKDIEPENILLVRVSPVNADLAAANLKLVNSLGEDLNDFVVVKATPYKELLTRAGETGIWQVSIALKDGIDRDKLATAAHATFTRNKKNQKSVATYAIAVSNTENDESRFAVSPYDLKPLLNEYKPATDIKFTVNGEDVANIKNRWDYAGGPYVKAEDGSLEKDTTYWELSWNTAEADAGEFTVPAVKAQKNVGKGNAYNNYVNNLDSRINKQMLQVQVDEPIVIKFPKAQWSSVDRYYVLFEKDNAIESAPSEYESWVSYNVENLGLMKKVQETTTLSVPATAANGDVIGFRVYAVNYDGTLVDPDGKAFYVQVGSGTSAVDPEIITATFKPRKANTAPSATDIVKDSINGVIIDFDAASKFNIANKTVSANFANFGLVSSVQILTTTQDNIMTLALPTTANLYYLKEKTLKDDAAQLASTFDEIKYIAIGVKNPENIVDGEIVETEPLTIKDNDKNDKVLGYISFVLKKGELRYIAPAAEASKFSWKSGQNGTFYLASTVAKGTAAGQWGDPSGLFSTNAWPANRDLITLTDYANGLENYATGYTWKLEPVDKSTVTTDGIAGVFGPAAPAFDAPYAWIENNKATATFTITKTGATVDGISRTWNAGTNHTNANTQSTQASSTAAAVVNQTLTFANPLAGLTFTLDLGTYRKGEIGYAATTEKQALIMDWTGANPLKPALAYKGATESGGTPNLVTAASFKYASADASITAAAANEKLKAGSEIETLFKVANTPLTTFGPVGVGAAGDWDDWFYTFAPTSSTDATPSVHVIGNNGTDEYLTANYNKATGVVTFAKVASAPAILPQPVNLTLRIKLQDRFKKTYTVDVPFELLP